MPTTIRYMSWNIQNFGRTTEMATAARGADAAQFANFFAAMVMIKNVDIVAVMEVMPDSRAHLDSLLVALNSADTTHWWYYDYIKSTVATKQGSPVTSKDNLGWKSGQRTEGYAIFWRTIASFAMQAAAVSTSEGTIKMTKAPALGFTSCLSLSQVGRKLDNSILIDAETGYEPTNPAGGNWGPSLYPSAAKLDSNRPLWAGSRRPATCTINLGITGAPPCTLSVYHAPSKQPAAGTGTYIAGLAQELYTLQAGTTYTALNHVIASGDYNTKVNTDWDDYRSFRAPFGTTSEAGANCQAVNEETTYVKTTVQLNDYSKGHFSGDPITSADPEDYYFLPIDDLFWRSSATADNWIWILIEGCMAGGSLVGNPIKAYGPYLEGLVKTSLDKKWGTTKGVPNDSNEDPLFPQILNWKTFLADVKKGQFATARRAAEFVHIFLSDHLPLVAELTFA